MRSIVEQIEKQEQEGDGDGGSDSDGNEQSGGSDKNSNKGKDGEKMPGSYVKSMNPSDPSTPINEKEAKRQLAKRGDTGRLKRGEEMNSNGLARSVNQMARASRPDNGDGDWLEDFMKLVFNDKIEYNQAGSRVPAVRTFNSIDEYKDYLRTSGFHYHLNDWRDQDFAHDMLDVYNSISKVSLKNLFMERTMDIEKSQPARSGIALIPTRIVNIFTDEKIFSPLPETLTERDSEVIILVDASGSMQSKTLKFDINGRRSYTRLYNGVIGAAYALAEGFRQANVACSVFQHTTVPADKDAVVVVKITDEYSSTIKNDFQLANEISSNNNGDSYAILATEQFFSVGGKQIGKTLIVISDGQPACGAYTSVDNGRIETKEAVNRLRDNGVSVYSVSLVEDVVRWNNTIYGDKNNFFPVDDVGDSTVSLEPMLKKIVDIVAKESVRSADNVLTQG
jgi:hypothetical protein